jgi:rubredoxin
MVVAETVAGLGAFKAMLDLAKSLRKIDDAVKRNEAVAELWEQILTAQQRYSAAIEEAKELKAEVGRLKNWEADKNRYQLTDIGNGVVALALKPAMSNGEPLHYICPDCAASGKKSYLQPLIRGPYHDQYKCNGCGFEIGIDKGTPPNSNWEPIDDN